MDYRELLKKYMSHVIDCEGIAFIDDIGRYSDSVGFTSEEVAELKQIKAEALA